MNDPKKIITSQDIATLAGVSRGTVDRVINNRSGVKKETREKIESIIFDLGYVPSRAGRALSSSKKPLRIAILLNRGENEFYDDIIKGMECCKEDYSDFTLDYDYHFLERYDLEEQLAAIQALLSNEPELLLITPIQHPEISEAINNITLSGVPVITVNSDITETKRLLHVGCDYYASGQTAAGLLQLLCENNPAETVIGIVTGSKQMLGHRLRVEGFLDTLGKLDGFSHAETIESFDQDAHAYTQVRAMVERNPAITAVYFAASGVKGGIAALEEQSQRYTIITCDDVPYIKKNVKNGRIQATVCQEPFRQGYEAIHQGLQYLLTGHPPEPNVLYMKNEIKIAQNID